MVGGGRVRAARGVEGRERRRVGDRRGGCWSGCGGRVGEGGAASRGAKGLAAGRSGARRRHLVARSGGVALEPVLVDRADAVVAASALVRSVRRSCALRRRRRRRCGRRSGRRAGIRLQRPRRASSERSAAPRRRRRCRQAAGLAAEPPHVVVRLVDEHLLVGELLQAFELVVAQAEARLELVDAEQELVALAAQVAQSDGASARGLETRSARRPRRKGGEREEEGRTRRRRLRWREGVRVELAG